MKYIKTVLKWLWKILRAIFILILIPFVLFFLSWSYHSVNRAFHGKESRWQKDIDKFQKALLTKHINPAWAGEDYLAISRKMDSLRSHVSSNEGEVDKHRMRVAFMQVSALLKDGHTRIANYSDEVGDFPILAGWYDDGLYIYAADSTVRETVGAAVIAIDDQPIETILKAVGTISPASNFSGKKQYAETYFKKPGLLYGLGLIQDATKATVTFQKQNGEQFDLELDGFSERKGWVSLEAVSGNETSWYRRDRTKPYWYEYDEGRRLLYMRYSSVGILAGTPMDAFVDEMMQVADTEPVDKFIIDLRGNGGGNNFYTLYLLSEVMKRPKINKKGVFYAITDHNTFSAAISFATNLRTKTKATFVGESIGDLKISPGDPLFTNLRMNRMTWWISDMLWENSFYGDTEAAIPVEIPVAQNFSALWNGTNPTIDRILADTIDSSNSLFIPDSTKSYFQSGRYQFSPDKTLMLDVNDLSLELSGKSSSSLYWENDSTLVSDALSFRLMMDGRDLVLTNNDGASRKLPAMNPDQFTALELLEMRRYEDAKEAYRALFERYGEDLLALHANVMSMQAAHLYYFYNDNEMRKALLEVALEFHPKAMMPLGEMSGAKSIDGNRRGSIWYGFRALLRFDWPNVLNYGKAFGYL